MRASIPSHGQDDQTGIEQRTFEDSGTFTSDAEKYPLCFPLRLDLRTTQFTIVQDGKVTPGMGWDFIRDVNFRNALVKVIVLPTRVWATGDKGGTNLLTTCLVVKPGAGSPEIVITDFPDEDLL